MDVPIKLTKGKHSNTQAEFMSMMMFLFNELQSDSRKKYKIKL